MTALNKHLKIDNICLQQYKAFVYDSMLSSTLSNEDLPSQKYSCVWLLQLAQVTRGLLHKILFCNF